MSLTVEASADHTRSDLSRALEVGATGYVLKDTSSEEVLKAFQKVREGSPISATISPRVVHGGEGHDQSAEAHDRAVDARSAEGKPYGVIAEHLHVSYKTVANSCNRSEFVKAEIAPSRPCSVDHLVVHNERHGLILGERVAVRRCHLPERFDTLH